MKIFDEKGRLFGFFNIVDLCIIVFLIAAAGGAYAYLNKNVKSTSPAQYTYNVTLEYKCVEKYFCDAMVPGKTVYDRVQSKPFGVLNDVRIEPVTEYNVSSQDGSTTKVTVPERYNAQLDMQITTKSKLYIGNYLSIATKDFTGAGCVIKAELVDSQGNN